MTKRQAVSYYSKPIAQIHADFKGICALCGEFVEINDASRDHINPRANGGGNGRDNIQLAHKNCNNLKGDEVYPVDWKEQLKREMVIPMGYRCQYCEREIEKWHKKGKFVAKVFHNRRIVALHSWCNEERVKYGKTL